MSRYPQFVYLILVSLTLAISCSGAEAELEKQRQAELLKKIDAEKKRVWEERLAEVKRLEEEKQRAEEARIVEKKRLDEERKARIEAELVLAMERADELKREQEAKRKAEEKRLSDMGFEDWSTACDQTDIMKVGPLACANVEGSYNKNACEKNRKGRIKAKWIYTIKTPAVVTYEEKRKRFKVEIPKLLYADAGLDVSECWRGCSGTWISSKPLKVTGGSTNFVGWAKRFAKASVPHVQTLKTVYVPESAVGEPKKFEENLLAEALVRVVDTHGVYVGEWFNISNIQVKVVGLRVGLLPDLKWGVVPIKYKRGTPTCPPVGETSN